MNTTHEHTENQAGQTRSIDFWARTISALVAREVEQGFRSEGLSPRDLRVLTAIAKLNAEDAEEAGEPAGRPGANATDARIRERIARGGRRIAKLEWRGWVRRTEPGAAELAAGATAGAPSVGYELTEEGKAAQERLEGIAEGVTWRLAGTVSTEDLAVTTAALETMARELGWEEGMRLPRPELGRRGGARGRGHGHGGRGHGGRGHGGRGPGAPHRAHPHVGAGHDRSELHDAAHIGQMYRGPQRPDAQRPGAEHPFGERGHGHGGGDSHGHGRGNGRGHGHGHGAPHRGRKHWQHGFAAGFAAAKEG